MKSVEVKKAESLREIPNTLNPERLTDQNFLFFANEDYL